ncbi:hypothetical protein HCC61_11765 [Streptomyces sp. HNM0575]|uniref:hypothetical protein n=1 Tax=Streptomyces sp. HNM0575 TaxID=2716338 RepID=UPI00145C5BD1|nr:hypothetical protein [Streptomyces sp. HNM0575]NLU73346.1 hypothetical protein [Streptomyces sp. HNM0575]
MVALSHREYENLAAMRRQLGSQGARLRNQRDLLVSMAELLDALRTALREHERSSGSTPQGDGRVIGPRVDELLERVPGLMESARKVIGGAAPCGTDAASGPSGAAPSQTQTQTQTQTQA